MRAHCCTTLVLVLSPLLATTAAAAPAGRPPVAVENAPPPRALPFSVALTSLVVRHVDDSYRVLGEPDKQGSAALEVSYDLYRPGQDHRLSLGLGLVEVDRGPPDGFNRVEATLSAISYYALASIGFRRQQAVQPFLTLAAGFTRADFTIERSSGPRMQGRDHGAFGRASGGLRLAPRWLTYHDRQKQPVVGMFFSLELGVLLGSRLTFDIHPDGLSASGTDSGIDPIRVDSVRAGDVMPTTLFGGLGLGLSF